MKYLITFLFCAIICTAQTNSIPSQNLSVISAEKMNVVYRGIDNPIKIAVPGAVSFRATAPGMRLDSIKGSGNYIINPGPGNELTVNVVAKMPDGTSKTEKKIFRIKGIPAPYTQVNNLGSEDGYLHINKDQLKNAIISARLNILMLTDTDLEAERFNVKIKNKVFHIQGSKITDEVFEKIKKLKKGGVIIISHVIPQAYNSPEISYKAITPLLITVTD